VTQTEHHDVVGPFAGNDQGQILVLLVVTVKECELLIAVGRVIDGVEVEGERDGWFGEGRDELIDEDVAEPPERRDVDEVLEAGECGLTGEVLVVGRAVGEEFEGGVGAKCIVIVLIFVAREDAEDPHAGHIAEGVFDAIGIARIVQGVGKLLGESNAVIELPHEKEAGIGGEGSIGQFDVDGFGEKIEVVIERSV
jgi:hypothetical protein